MSENRNPAERRQRSRLTRRQSQEILEEIRKIYTEGNEEMLIEYAIDHGMERGSKEFLDLLRLWRALQTGT
jgi:hypothetical protein